MSSFIYLASGGIYDDRLMKIGKSNRPEHREKALGIKIDLVLRLESAKAAFIEETLFRKQIKRLGAVSYNRSFDWFLYNEAIYQRVRSALLEKGAFCFTGASSKPATSELDLDIARLRARYRKILRKEAEEKSLIKERDKLNAQISELLADLEMVKAENRKAIDRCYNEFREREGRLREQIGALKMQLRAAGITPIDLD